MLRKLSFDTVFKTILILFIGYFLFLLTNIANTMRNNSEVGRYQFDKDGTYVIDTKTGKTKEAEY
jgi:hypothetical protein